ncbi:uncharacterized protein LOC117123714 [Anneissia japonica]|nr:uncharacterized protein LOC117123714 [Anneissia japonica]
MNVYNWFANRRKDRKRKAREIANGQTSDASGDVESLDSVDDLGHDQLSPNASNAENMAGTSNLPTNTDFFSQINTNSSQKNADNQLGVVETSLPTSIMPVPLSLEVHGSSMKDEDHRFVGHVRSLLEN